MGKKIWRKEPFFLSSSKQELINLNYKKLKHIKKAAGIYDLCRFFNL
jgi:hypothetical protein